MTKRRGRVLSFISFFAFALLGHSEPPATPASGLEGVIAMSPSRPGPLRKDAVNSTAPVGNIAFVVSTAGNTVASFTTDAEGHFHVPLPPGHYIISRKDSGAAIGQWRFEADIEAGKVAKVRWTGDSGMR